MERKLLQAAVAIAGLLLVPLLWLWHVAALNQRGAVT
jgi:hypothetical protein